MYHLLFNEVYSGKSRYDLAFKMLLFSMICWIFFLFYGMIRDNSIKKNHCAKVMMTVVYGKGGFVDCIEIT